MNQLKCCGINKNITKKCLVFGIILGIKISQVGIGMYLFSLYHLKETNAELMLLGNQPSESTLSIGFMVSSCVQSLHKFCNIVVRLVDSITYYITFWVVSCQNQFLLRCFLSFFLLAQSL